jgi:uncharacterized membrane protein YgcG
MQPSVNKILGALALCLLLCRPAVADTELTDLRISVMISDNGDAAVTETRRMHIDQENTECYIAIAQLDGCTIDNLKVTDEHQHIFQILPQWDVNASRSEKALRAGIVSKGDGVEICWGLGDEGERTYIVEYAVRGLLRSYDDTDGFHYRFVADKLNQPPRHAEVTIGRVGTALSKESVRFWSFHHHGNISLRDGMIVAEADGPLGEYDAITIMMEADKGVFHPWRTGLGEFAGIKEQAFKNSDYGPSLMDRLRNVGSWAIGILALCGCLAAMLWSPLKTWRFRRRVMKGDDWWRELPFDGNLQKANQVINAASYSTANTRNYIGASVLRLISMGALKVVPSPRGRGQLLAIGRLPERYDARLTTQLRQLHDVLAEAAGDDGILQHKELKYWLRKNRKKIEPFMEGATKAVSTSDFDRQLDECRHVFALRRMLKDFTLASERHVAEVYLWKDYLIYAELFGIAKQVRKDMQAINPDINNLNDVYRAMFDADTLSPVVYSTWQAVKSSSESSRNSGGGGSSSYGGGGGFSGGGSGGGAR